MQASAQVLQGETYHLKIVIDDKDVHSIGCHDSALFIKGRACDAAVDLGINLTDENGMAVCYGDDTTIDTNLDEEEFDFVWFKADTELAGETSSTLTVTEAGNYKVNATYKNSTCGLSGSIVVEYKEEIKFDITEDVTVCEGTSALIEVTPQNFTATDATYRWTRDGQPISDTSASLSTAVPGFYEVTITFNGCSVTGAATLTIVEAPTADAPEDVETCGSYTLPALPPDSNYFTGAGGSGTKLNPSETITTSQTIYVYAVSTNSAACTAEDSFKVTIIPSLDFSLGGPYLLCGQQEVTINVLNANFDTTKATYLWTFNGNPITETGNSLAVFEIGTYTVSVTLSDCPDVTKSVTVQENTLGVAVEIEEFCNGNVLMIRAAAVNDAFDADNVSYFWTGPDNFTTTSAQFEVPSKGNYTVVITTSDGCSGTSNKNVGSITCGIQKGISPNGDGLNETFNLENMDVRLLKIFNRYGRQVYEQQNYKNEWYGQSDSGNELPTGTYYYMIEQSNGDSTTGWIYINREK